MATTESASNNTKANADSLELGSTLTGGLTSTDVDYFKIDGDDIGVDSLVSVLFTPSVPGIGKEWTVDLVNSQGTSLLSGGSQDVTASTTVSARVNDTDGSVYLKVSPSQYSGSMDYTVLANAAPAVEFEDNDEINKATPLTKGVEVEGVLGSTSSPDGSDVDYYLFTIAEAGTVSVALASATSTASSNVYTAMVRTADGQTVVYNGQQVTKTFGAQSTTSTIEFAGSAGSTYFLEIAASSGEETNFTSADDDREAYTIELSGTATLNNEPVVTIGSKSSAARGTTTDSGVSQSIKIDSSINLVDVVDVTDAQGDDTIQDIKVLLVDSDNAGTAAGGYLTIGGVAVNPVASLIGNAYQTVSVANWATATYTAGTTGDTSTPQTLYVYAVDSSGATTAVSDAGSTLAFNSRVDTGGIVSMELVSVDADIIAQVAGATDQLGSASSIGSVTEDALDKYQDIDFYIEGILASDASVSVTLQAMNSDGDLVADLEYYTADGNGDYTVQLDSNLFTLAPTNTLSSPKTVRVFAIDDGQADVEDLTLSFVTNSSSAPAFDNLSKGIGTLAVAEKKASFTVSDPVFSSGSSLSESDTSRTATYTITANDLVGGVPLTVDVSTDGGLSVSPSTLIFERTESATLSRTIAVSAVDDNDVETWIHEGTLTFAVSEGSNTTKYAGAISGVSVDISDNDDSGSLWSFNVEDQSTSDAMHFNGAYADVWGDGGNGTFINVTEVSGAYSYAGITIGDRSSLDYRQLLTTPLPLSPNGNTVVQTRIYVPEFMDDGVTPWGPTDADGNARAVRLEIVDTNADHDIHNVHAEVLLTKTGWNYLTFDFSQPAERYSADAYDTETGFNGMTSAFPLVATEAETGDPVIYGRMNLFIDWNNGLAYDGKAVGTPLSGNVSYLVDDFQVPRLQNREPAFGSPIESVSIAENSDVATVVYTASASDIDGDALTYSLSGPDASLLTINSSTGAVTLNSPADYETKNQYLFTVAGSDGSLSDSIDVTLDVLDVEAPITFEVRSASALGAVVDVHLDPSLIGPAITHLEGYQFKIEPTVGWANFGKVFETADFTFSDQYTEFFTFDGFGGEVSLGDSAPDINSYLTNSVIAANGYVANGTILTSAGRTAKGVSADGYPLSGKLKLGSITLDGAPKGSSFEFDATDIVISGGASGFSADGVSFTITYENTPPVLSANAVSVSVTENSDVATAVYTASATDVDGDTLTYSLSGTDASLLSIDSSTGAVTLNAPADYETKDQYLFTVTASDGSLTDTVDVTLDVSDVTNITGEISGLITEDQEWSGEITVTGSIKVTSGTITIAPGTVINVEPGNSAQIWFDGGQLISQGTALNPVIFQTDDTVIYQQSDWSSSQSVGGGWIGLRFTDDSTTSATADDFVGSNIQHTQITGAAVGVYVENQGLLVKDVLFDSNQYDIVLGPNADGVRIEDSVFTASEDAGFESYLPDIETGYSKVDLNIPYSLYDDIGTSSVENVWLHNNEFEDGVKIWQNQRIVDNIFVDENVFGSKALGLQIGGGGYGSHIRDLEITDNLFLSENGIHLDAYSWGDQDSIILIKNNAYVGEGRGFYAGHADSAPSNLSIEENLYVGSEIAIGNGSFNGVTLNADLRFNIFYQTEKAIDLPSASVIVEDNAFVNATGSIYTSVSSNSMFNNNNITGYNGSQTFETSEDPETAYSFSGNYFDSTSLANLVIDDGSSTFTEATIGVVSNASTPNTAIESKWSADLLNPDTTAFNEGQTVTAITTLIPETFQAGSVSFQWFRDGVERVGETAQTYQLTSDDIGSIISVKYSYLDQNGDQQTHLEWLTTKVLNVNEAPVFSSATTTATIAENSDVAMAVYTASATDVDGDSLIYSLSGTDASALTIESSSGVVTLNAPADYESKDQYSFTVTAFDGSLTDTVNVTLDVTDINDAPVFASSTASVSVAENSDVSTVVFTASASDVDGDLLSYWLSGTDASLLTIDASTGAVTLKASADYETKDQYQFTVTASDGSLTDTVDVTLDVTDGNEVPVFAASTASVSVAENSDVATAVYTASATDVDGDTLAYSLSGTDASLLSIDSSTGAVALKASADYETKNQYLFTVTASDGSLTDTVDVTLDVTDVVENLAPVITSTPLGSVLTDTLYQYQITATDADGDALTYVASGLPSWLQFDPTTVTLSGTPTDDAMGTTSITLSVDDGSETVIQSFDLVVTDGRIETYGTNSPETLNGDVRDDRLYGQGGDDVINALAGDDRLYGQEGDDHLFGGEGNDELYGGYDDDILEGGAGDDYLDGEQGADLLIGGPGNDTYYISDSRDTIDDQGLETDIDTVVLVGLSSYTLADGIDNATLDDSAGNGSLNGNAIDNILTGNTGNNTLNGGLGADTLLGGSGDDTLQLDADGTWGVGFYAQNVSQAGVIGSQQLASLNGRNKFSDVVDGGEDSDEIVLTDADDAFFLHDSFSALHSSLTQTADNTTARVIDLETISAGDGDDLIDLTSENFSLASIDMTLNGEAGDDVLWAAQGDDTLNGGAGNDILNGASGNDTLTGGSGADIFEFTATSGNDTITDYNQSEGDILRFFRRSTDISEVSVDAVRDQITWQADSHTVTIDFDTDITASTVTIEYELI